MGAVSGMFTMGSPTVHKHGGGHLLMRLLRLLNDILTTSLVGLAVILYVVTMMPKIFFKIKLHVIMFVFRCV